MCVHVRVVQILPKGGTDTYTCTCVRLAQILPKGKQYGTAPTHING